MHDGEFAVDSDGLRQDGRLLDDSAQSMLALESQTLNATAGSAEALGTMAVGLTNAMSRFGQAWSAEAQILAIRTATLSRQVIEISAAAENIDQGAASAIDGTQ